MKAPRILKQHRHAITRAGKPFWDVRLPSGVVVTYGAKTREEVLALARSDMKGGL